GVTRSGTRLRNEGAVEDLGDEMLGHRPQILVGCASLRRLTHGPLNVASALRQRMPSAYGWGSITGALPTARACGEASRALLQRGLQPHDVAGLRQSARLELAGELGGDVPAARLRGPRQRHRQRRLDVRSSWPSADRLTRTYVNSRRVIGGRTLRE